MSNGQHQTLFEPDLLRDEKIMWSGQPDPSINFTKADFFLVPFSLCFFVFVLYWVKGVMTSMPLTSSELGGTAMMFYLFGIVFGLFAVYVVFGRFLYKKWKKIRTYYALTDRRALILTLAFGRESEGVFLDRLASINKSVRSDGTGSIYFGNQSWVSSAYGNTGMDFFSGFYSAEVPSFFDIKAADAVYDLANSLR